MPIHFERAMANGETTTLGRPTVSLHRSLIQSGTDFHVYRAGPAFLRSSLQQKPNILPKKIYPQYLSISFCLVFLSAHCGSEKIFLGMVVCFCLVSHVNLPLSVSHPPTSL